jgi:hypothetical protein
MGKNKKAKDSEGGREKWGVLARVPVHLVRFESDQASEAKKGKSALLSLRID